MNRKTKKSRGKALKRSAKKELFLKSVFTAAASFFAVFCAAMTIGLAEECFTGAVLFGIVGGIAVLVGLNAGVWDE